jgi:transglutaminase-like putative cysteine protease
MRVYQKGILAFLLIVGAAPASEPQGKVVRETWDAAFLDNAKAGYVHTVTRAVGAEDQKVLQTTMELDLTVKRFNDLAHMRMESGTEETEDGTVVAVFMKQSLGKDQQLVVRGTVKGEQLHEVVLQGDGRTFQKNKPWNSKVIGLYRQEGIFRERQAKPGMRFSYLSYQPEVVTSVRTNVTVKDYEEVSVPGSSKKQRLLRVEETSEKLQGFQLPPLTLWLDKELSPVRSQVEIKGLGLLTLYRTTRASATATGGPVAKVTDIGYTQLISLNKRIPNPYGTRSAVYRITVKGDDEPATTFARDGRQEVKNAKGDTFELHVRANPKAQEGESGSKVGDEFLQSCYFINSEDPLVQQHAREAVGKESDPLKKARRIEKWVHHHMENKNFTEAFATSDHVAKTLEGDCTEHAVLAAAMCRVVGIPSRAAVGLIYVNDRRRGPVMGFHMWAEAWVDGRWYPIDATLGLGYVGATHLKIADHSWHDMQSLTPLLPALRVLGKVSIEVVRVDGSD